MNPSPHHRGIPPPSSEPKPATTFTKPPKDISTSALLISTPVAKLDPTALLKSQGWRGHGNSLHPTSNTIGLSHPILFSNKQNAFGIGVKAHRSSDNWWLNAFDTQLKGLETTADGRAVVNTIARGPLSAVSRGGQYGVIGRVTDTFVRGGLMDGTMGKTGLEGDGGSSSSDSSSDDEEEDEKKNTETPQTSDPESILSTTTATKTPTRKQMKHAERKAKRKADREAIKAERKAGKSTVLAQAEAERKAIALERSKAKQARATQKAENKRIHKEKKRESKMKKKRAKEEEYQAIQEAGGPEAAKALATKMEEEKRKAAKRMSSEDKTERRVKREKKRKAAERMSPEEKKERRARKEAIRRGMKSRFKLNDTPGEEQ